MVSSAVLSAFTPSAGQAQACTAGPFADYVNLSGPNSCTIAGITLTWAPFGGISGDVSNVNVTPLAGSNANGSYFGFRMTSSRSAPVRSTSASAADAQVPNPNYDPNDPTAGPEFLPYLQPTESNSYVGWRFTHSLSAPNAITRLELQTLGTRAGTTNQEPFPPLYLPSGAPDVNTGCGWNLEDVSTGISYSAARPCAYFRATSNNYLWREISDNVSAQTVWQSTGQFQYPGTTSAYCQENGTSVTQLGSGCTSYYDLTGTNWGTFVSFALNQSAGAMRQFGAPNEQGIFDAPFSDNLGAWASVDEAEFRIYYQTGNTVVPEPDTWALMAMGLAGVFVVARRRNATRAQA